MSGINLKNAVITKRILKKIIQKTQYLLSLSSKFGQEFVEKFGIYAKKVQLRREYFQRFGFCLSRQIPNTIVAAETDKLEVGDLLLAVNGIFISDMESDDLEIIIHLADRFIAIYQPGGNKFKPSIEMEKTILRGPDGYKFRFSATSTPKRLNPHTNVLGIQFQCNRLQIIPEDESQFQEDDLVYEINGRQANGNFDGQTIAYLFEQPVLKIIVHRPAFQRISRRFL